MNMDSHSSNLIGMGGIIEVFPENPAISKGTSPEGNQGSGAEHIKFSHVEKNSIQNTSETGDLSSNAIEDFADPEAEPKSDVMPLF